MLNLSESSIALLSENHSINKLLGYLLESAKMQDLIKKQINWEAITAQLKLVKTYSQDQLQKRQMLSFQSIKRKGDLL